MVTKMARNPNAMIEALGQKHWAIGLDCAFLRSRQQSPGCSFCLLTVQFVQAVQLGAAALWIQKWRLLSVATEAVAVRTLEDRGSPSVGQGSVRVSRNVA